MTRRPLSVALVVLVLLGGCSPAETPETATTAETAANVPDMELETLQQRAEQGHADAQSRLGYMYDTGEGVPQDDVEAVKWYRLAADQGHDAAQYLLGVMYNSGRGVPQDYTQAFIWYRLAADQGYAAAQYNLGVLYDTGQGVPQDDQFDADVAYKHVARVVGWTTQGLGGPTPVPVRSWSHCGAHVDQRMAGAPVPCVSPTS